VIVKGLGKIAHPDAVPHLLDVLHHAPSLCLQTASAKALERVGTVDAQEAAAVWRKERN
jgi:hypothetical protein